MTQPATSSSTPFDAAVAATVHRVKAEFLEMPGLRLTVAQAARLWNLDEGQSAAVLAFLVEMHFLVRTRNAAYSRP